MAKRKAEEGNAGTGDPAAVGASDPGAAAEPKKAMAGKKLLQAIKAASTIEELNEISLGLNPEARSEAEAAIYEARRRIVRGG